MNATTMNATGPAAPGWRRGARLWPWALLALAVMALLLGAALVAELNSLLQGHAPGGWQITIDGEPMLPPDLHAGHVLLAVGIALLVALLVLLVVPLAVGLGLLAAALGIGLALLATVGVVALVLSPLWLIALALWLALRS